MWKRWSVVLVGELSGRTTQVSFARFRRKMDAQEFCDRMNRKLPGYTYGDRVIRYALFDRKTGEVLEGCG